MIDRPLDLDAVQAFTRIAELGSFTRAAEAMQTTQAAVSLKLKRLEARPSGSETRVSSRFVALRFLEGRRGATHGRSPL